MSEYVNGCGVGIAEMARLKFYDAFNGEQVEIVELVMPLEVLKNLAAVIENTIKQHEENLAKQIELNKGMN